MQMRAMIANGDIGEIRMVELQYTHGFNANESADTFEAQKWRVDPKIAGPSFVLGDISTHTFYISQLVMPDMKIASLLCDRQSFIPSRAPLEDNAMVLMHYENGAVGRMWASAINAGAMDSQSIRVVGSRASLQWSDSTPGELRYEIRGSPTKRCTTACPIWTTAPRPKSGSARCIPKGWPNPGQYLPQVRHRHQRQPARRSANAGRADLSGYRRRIGRRALD